MKKLLFLFLSFGIFLFTVSTHLQAQTYYLGSDKYYDAKGYPHKTVGPFVKTDANGRKYYYYRIWYYKWRRVNITRKPVWRYYNNKWYVTKNCTGTYWTYTSNKKAKIIYKVPKGGIYKPTKGH